MSVHDKPLLPLRRQVVAGRVVDDQEDFAPLVFRDEPLEEGPEGFAIEDVGEPVGEVRLVKSNRRIQVGGLPLAIGVDPGLTPNACPRSVKRAIEPKAGFVLEEDYSTAGCSFFFIRGNFVRSQYACRSWSARASRFRGRCTENPSLCSSTGM